MIYMKKFILLHCLIIYSYQKLLPLLIGIGNNCIKRVQKIILGHIKSKKEEDKILKEHQTKIIALPVIVPEGTLAKEIQVKIYLIQIELLLNNRKNQFLNELKKDRNRTTTIYLSLNHSEVRIIIITRITRIPLNIQNRIYQR